MASQPPARQNAPATALSHIATDPFQSLRSGYNVAIYIVKNILGLDPSIIINLSIFLAAGSTVFRYVYAYLAHYARQFIISSVRIHEDDLILYHDVMRFMTEKHLKGKMYVVRATTNVGQVANRIDDLDLAANFFDRFRSVKASTHSRVTLLRPEDDEPRSAPPDLDASMDDFVNYRTERQRSKISYQPYAISHVFYHARNFYLFTHSLRQIPGGHPSLGMRVSGELTIECLGRSLKPIQNLLEEAQTYSLRRSIHSTNICRANSQNWMMIGRRPSRDINTVILDKIKKQALLRDINEYLHPTTKKWYGSHGIPYRRGYLFSGPPGTGKTSLTAALAGVFGLDIYVLSLLDPYINEDALTRLFSSVPPRSIVLLEDIDAAGITSKRRKKPMSMPMPPKMLPVVNPPGMIIPVNPGIPPPPPSTKNGISLSGLLNAIDGVSSSEGHVLIMTTNVPEELDKALVRPGRVDMHIHFELPHRPEITEMFMNMYKDLAVTEAKKLPIKPKVVSELQKLERLENGEAPEAKAAAQKVVEALTKQELEELADRFADHIPEGKLSLAAIQGHLVKHKKDPRHAVEIVTQWVEEALKEEAEKEDEKAAEAAKEDPLAGGVRGTNWLR